LALVRLLPTPGVESEATPRNQRRCQIRHSAYCQPHTLRLSPFSIETTSWATKITINNNPNDINIKESRARHRAFLVAEPPSKEEGSHTLLPRKPVAPQPQHHGYLKARRTQEALGLGCLSRPSRLHRQRIERVQIYLRESIDSLHSLT
jgi:hypothetical protein